MAIKLTIIIDDEQEELLKDAIEDVPAEKQLRLLQYLMADAFGEFSANRGPSAEAYVAKRYPSDSHGWMNRTDKVKEVMMRTIYADILRAACASGHIKLEHIDDKDARMEIYG